MQKETIQSIIESFIFVSERPLKITEIQAHLEEVGLPDIKQALQDIEAQYQKGHHGIYLEYVAEGYQFRTKLDKAPWLQKLTDQKPTRLTRAQLETLAIVAYKDPVTRVEIDAIRGVDSSHILKMLVDKKLIKILGVKEVPGRPLLYGTTLDFLEFFNLEGKSALPKLEDLKELEPNQTGDLPLFHKKDAINIEELEETRGEVHSSNANKSSGS